ncbi:hypothetical protein NP233_g2477 [Leucocoprinus birnbaumii]|uniref:Uncharacterized protein n=1 Tax=Leucocoprinus birnbaumii TaxID=56174 RepID=A0AAD5W291_9AGAR|nr:hypothetical protein NP233_g2477 [Leucocoprinus birnbaumii]
MNGKPTKSQTPFIDATVEFLKEYIEKAQDPSSSRKSKTDGGGSSLQQPSKKELFSAKEFDDAEGEGKDEWSESFCLRRSTKCGTVPRILSRYVRRRVITHSKFVGSTIAPSSSAAASAVKTKLVEEKEEPDPPEEDGWL